jgi:soluble lytic murein transglycosylase-like protein
VDADAQIYAWRDVNGTLVLSDRKLNDGAMTYVVPEAPGIRATTPMASATVREQFEPLIREHASRQALRVELVRAVIQVESGYNPSARSPKGAMGLMQLSVPAAAARSVRWQRGTRPRGLQRGLQRRRPSRQHRPAVSGNARLRK